VQAANTEHPTTSVGAWLASDGARENAIASKPAPTGFVQARQYRPHPRLCRSLACQRWRPQERHRQIKPAPTGFVQAANTEHPTTSVGAWLASDGARENAIASKPAPTGFVQALKVGSEVIAFVKSTEVSIAKL